MLLIYVIFLVFIECFLLSSSNVVLDNCDDKGTYGYRSYILSLIQYVIISIMALYLFLVGVLFHDITETQVDGYAVAFWIYVGMAVNIYLLNAISAIIFCIFHNIIRLVFNSVGLIFTLLSDIFTFKLKFNKTKDYVNKNITITTIFMEG